MGFFDYIFGDYFNFRDPGPLPRQSHYADESVFQQGYTIEEYVSVELLPYRNTTANVYGLVIDAGSTGSRIQCFKFEWRPSKPYMHLVSDCFEQISPGLSYHAAFPNNSVQGIE